VETMLQDAGWPTVLERHFRRGLAYARLGEFQQARREWKHCEKLKQGPSRFYRVLALASATYGIYPEGVSWARAAAQNLSSGDPRRVGYDRLSYPAAFYDAVSHWSKDRGLLTDEVWAMMRQESLYDPHAVSRAGARGLLQIMPSTLERMINQGDYPPATADVLFRPLVNIELSTRFFKDRLTEFDDMLLPALASYNAGEGKSHQWLERSQGDPNEMFLECVGYPETYGYIRRIVWMAWLYRSYYPKLAEQDLRDARTR
ncbi:MAG: lytic transglycosylase domain-containing protein, partial [Candidatus Eisenbacteria bacterium]|nr:lytic transglycosylase domain-containing protein [Candidatus Eisenbacteria bacterium]